MPMQSGLLRRRTSQLISVDRPRGYRLEWRHGSQALARNFGDCLATEVAAHTGKFLVGATLLLAIGAPVRAQ